jgi:hypothetical protein
MKKRPCIELDTNDGTTCTYLDSIVAIEQPIGPQLVASGKYRIQVRLTSGLYTRTWLPAYKTIPAAMAEAGLRVQEFTANNKTFWLALDHVQQVRREFTAGAPGMHVCSIFTTGGHTITVNTAEDAYEGFRILMAGAGDEEPEAVEEQKAKPAKKGGKEQAKHDEDPGQVKEPRDGDR